jgi:curved DNA-binding protein CbpA/ankyrin repeat protein
MNRNAELETSLEASRSREDSLTRSVSRLEEDFRAKDAKAKDALKALDATLLSARFQLAEKSQHVFELLSALQELLRDADARKAADDEAGQWEAEAAAAGKTRAGEAGAAEGKAAESASAESAGVAAAAKAGAATAWDAVLASLRTSVLPRLARIAHTGSGAPGTLVSADAAPVARLSAALSAAAADVASSSAQGSAEALLAAARDGDVSALLAILQPASAAPSAAPASASASAFQVQATLTPILRQAFRIACAKGHVDTARELLAQGGHSLLLSAQPRSAAAATAPDAGTRAAADSWSALLRAPLHVAAASGHAAVAKFLVDQAAAAFAACSANATTAAASANRPAGLSAEAFQHEQQTLARRFRPLTFIDTADAYGRTALHLAVTANAPAVVRVLLKEGADPTARDMQGMTPVDLAKAVWKTADAEDALAASSGGGNGSGRSTPQPQTQTPSAAAGGSALVVGARAPRFPLFASGELTRNAPSPQCLRVFEADLDLTFWNHTLRANRHYADKHFERAIEAYSRALDTVESQQKNGTPALKASARDCSTLYYNRARARFRVLQHCEAIEDCSAALRHDATYRNALAQRGECYMCVFEYDRAARDFASLLEQDPTDRQWSDRLREAKKCRDLSHYGILGVRRDADASAIKKAYRTLCLRWHPDKHGATGEDAARATIAFRRISEAYETLSDANKRTIYDFDTRSLLGTPNVNIHEVVSAQGNKAAATMVEGFDKWYSREREREQERVAEVARAAEAQPESEPESVRSDARAAYKDRVTQGGVKTGSDLIFTLPEAPASLRVPTASTSSGAAGAAAKTAFAPSTARPTSAAASGAATAGRPPSAQPPAGSVYRTNYVVPPPPPQVHQYQHLFQQQAQSGVRPSPAEAFIRQQQEQQAKAASSAAGHVSDDDSEEGDDAFATAAAAASASMRARFEARVKEQERTMNMGAAGPSTFTTPAPASVSAAAASAASAKPSTSAAAASAAEDYLAKAAKRFFASMASPAPAAASTAASAASRTQTAASAASTAKAESSGVSGSSATGPQRAASRTQTGVAEAVDDSDDDHSSVEVSDIDVSGEDEEETTDDDSDDSDDDSDDDEDHHGQSGEHADLFDDDDDDDEEEDEEFNVAVYKEYIQRLQAMGGTVDTDPATYSARGAGAAPIGHSFTSKHNSTGPGVQGKANDYDSEDDDGINVDGPAAGDEDDDAAFRDFIARIHERRAGSGTGSAAATGVPDGQYPSLPKHYARESLHEQADGGLNDSSRLDELDAELAGVAAEAVKAVAEMQQRHAAAASAAAASVAAEIAAAARTD